MPHIPVVLLVLVDIHRVLVHLPRVHFWRLAVRRRLHQCVRCAVHYLPYVVMVFESTGLYEHVVVPVVAMAMCHACTRQQSAAHVCGHALIIAVDVDRLVLATWATFMVVLSLSWSQDGQGSILHHWGNVYDPGGMFHLLCVCEASFVVSELPLVQVLTLGKLIDVNGLI